MNSLLMASVGFVCFTKCSQASQQEKSGEEAGAEQTSLINYSQSLCTTPLSDKGGTEARMGGQM